LAVRGNNIIPNNHFRKWWQKYVRTWFNQAGRKKSRRVARQTKAKAIAPRPLGMLRPAVHPPTVRYNYKLRAGRGFTLEELKKAGIPKTKAKTIGIAVDHRRRNHCEESLNTNVARLEEYKSKLMVMPVKSKAKKGDTTRAEVEGATLAAPCKYGLPISQPAKRIKARAITADEKSTTVYKILRKARVDKKMFGRRKKRAAEKAAAEAEKKK
jgi:large subunit ribosomal protein L13e